MFSKILLTLALLMIINQVYPQPKSDKFLKDILEKPGNKLINQILQNPGAYRVQIIYTQINRDKKNQPKFKDYYFNYDPDLYFNPASMVKMPLAFMALEKLNTLNLEGVNKYTPIVFDSSYTGQKALLQDLSSASGLPSISHFIKRAFLISENDPYNRLYQFLGQQTINQNLHQKGYVHSRITRQFMGFTSEQNRHTNSLKFLHPNGSILYFQPPGYNPDKFNFSKKILLGSAYVNNNDSLVPEPFDFTEHNNFPLLDLHRILQSVMFPASVPKERIFKLKPDDYTFLYRYLSQYPSETPYPKYDTTTFFDSYIKFFFRKVGEAMPDGVRVFNKTGWAYGFLTDVSYVADFRNKVEYMLSATVYVNSDGILNDGKYDYDTIGYPFMYHLGQIIYQYELNRNRRYQPDLSAFQVPYEKRDPKDARPAIREVDN